MTRSLRVFFIGGPVRSDYMEEHVITTLQAMGHDVLHFNARQYIDLPQPLGGWLDRAATRVWREPERLFERRLVRAVDAHQPDLVLELLGSLISPKTIAKLRKVTRAPFVCWCQDQLSTLGRGYLIGADFDRVFVKDRYLVDKFRAMTEMPIELLPEACNPTVHRSVTPSQSELAFYRADIATYGNLYYYRQKILQHLTRYRLKVWGSVPDWLDVKLGDAVMRRSVFGEEKCKAIASSSILLNTLHYGELEGLNARAFEGSACGGFQLMSYSSVVSEYFVPGQEVVVFDSLRDLIDKVDHYLKDPDARLRIAAAGQRRCHSEHTYEHRLQALIDRTFGKN